MTNKPQAPSSVNTGTNEAALAISVKGLIASPHFAAKIAAALPRHLSPERYMRVVNNAILRTPNLLQCDPNSFANGMLLLSQYGLEPDGRRAHLIPFNNTQFKRIDLQVIIDWKGLAELILRSGTIAKLHADLICDRDEFEFDMGDVLHHRIDFRNQRGEAYAAWAMAQTKTGEKFVQVMQRDEIEKIRDNTPAWRAFIDKKIRSTPWNDHPGEMWKKTVFRRLSKWLPLSPELRDAIEMDDDELPATTVFASAAPTSSKSLVATTGPEIDAGPLAIGTSSPTTSDFAQASDGGDIKGPDTATAPVAAGENPASAAKEPTVALSELVLGAGFTFDDFRQWATETANVKDADSLAGFRDVPTADAARILKAGASLLKALRAVKGAQ